MADRTRIVDEAAFGRATALLVREIPEHINECFACRQGDARLDVAIRADDHAAAAAASQLFCPVGNALIQDYSATAAKALGLPWPPARKP